MTEQGAYEKLFKHINSQLESKNIIIKSGVIVDASVIDTPLRPKGRTVHKVVTEDRKDEQDVTVKKDYADSVDKDGT